MSESDEEDSRMLCGTEQSVHDLKKFDDVKVRMSTKDTWKKGVVLSVSPLWISTDGERRNDWKIVQKTNTGLFVTAMKRQSYMILFMVLTELIFCLVLSDSLNERMLHERHVIPDVIQYVGADKRPEVHLPKSMLPYMQAAWIVFASGLVLRVLVLFLWYWCKSKPRNPWFLPDSVLAGLFSLLHLLPFFFYFTIFFRAKDALMITTTSDKAWVTVTNHTKRDYETICEKAYDEATCEGRVSYGNSGDWCCVNHLASIKMSVIRLPKTFNLDFNGVWSVLSWTSVLAMSYAVQHVPILPTDETKFIKGAWLDILDCVNFGYTFLNHDRLLKRRRNIVATPHSPFEGRFCDGRGVPPGECTDLSYDWFPYFQATSSGVWTLWVISYVLAMLSPTIYTCLRFCNEDAEHARSCEEAKADLLNMITHLNQKEATKFLEESIKLQMDKYEKDAAKEEKKHEGHVVGVNEHLRPQGLMEEIEGMEEIQGLYDTLEEGTATEPKSPFANLDSVATYDVMYKHRKPRRNVRVEKLRPGFQKERMTCKTCCHGWCAFHQLMKNKMKEKEGKEKEGEAAVCCDDVSCDSDSDEDPKPLKPPRNYDRFENTARLLDSVRSLFFLELPFFLVRYYFNVSAIDGGWMGVLMLKNLLWGSIDFLRIISCANPKATIFGMQPISSFEHFAESNGKLNSIFYGPAGLWRIAADSFTGRAKDHIQDKIDKYQKHKTWLTMEHRRMLNLVQSGKVQGDTAAITQKIQFSYGLALEQMERNIKLLLDEKDEVKTF